MSSRKIIHVDMDAFFASVEQRDFPELRGKPVVVGGQPGKRGVVAAASYEARRFGVRSAMPSSQALARCPHLTFVRPRFEVYRFVSQQIRSIFYSYTDLVEPLSLDEAYLDVTSNKMDNPSATRIAREIRKKIFEATQLTASAGVAPNKFLAKLASDINKPNGLCVITPDKAGNFVEDLAIGHFHGIGKATEKKMKELGIENGRDLRAWTEHDLIRHFGKVGSWYFRVARGEDDREVSPERIAKSVGVEETFDHDLASLEDLDRVLHELADELASRLGRAQTSGKTVTLKLRFANFETITRSRSGRLFVADAASLYQQAKELLVTSGGVGQQVRLLGITVSNLDNVGEPEGPVQLLLPFMDGLGVEGFPTEFPWAKA